MPPRVFIWYAHDSAEHRAQVGVLAEILRDEYRLEVYVDQWYEDSRRDWSLFAIEQIRSADFVLAVASAAFKQRTEGRAAPGEGWGSQYEATIIRDQLSADRLLWTRKILPVVLPGWSIEDIPIFLAPHNADHYIIPELTPAGVTSLVSVINGQPQPPEQAHTPRETTGSRAMDNLEYDDLTDQPTSVRQTAFSTEHSSVHQAGRDINIFHRRPRSKWFKLFAILIVLMVTVSVGAWIVWPVGGASGEAWHEVLRRSSFELTRAMFSCVSGVEDKVDLDTGKRGHGDQPGVPTCTSDGGLAELILESDNVHTSSKNRRSLLAVGRSADATASFCADRLSSPSASRQYSIPLSALADGDQLCVQTDQDNIARVTIARIPNQTTPTMLIDFVVWRK